MRCALLRGSDVRQHGKQVFIAPFIIVGRAERFVFHYGCQDFGGWGCATACRWEGVAFDARELRSYLPACEKGAGWATNLPRTGSKGDTCWTCMCSLCDYVPWLFYTIDGTGATGSCHVSWLALSCTTPNCSLPRA